ncbi:MAG TPA: response regulator transcription factor [Candidatus Dormibacteraeota bacterium]|nr:response regulator transcription factor [Candidatus Dormibacteraeota bacterium]
MRVLVVEDEPDLAQAVVRGLSRSGFAVDLAEDGAQALEKTWASAYDVIVLDRDLPAVHGDDVCRRLAGAGSLSRILMLTASGTVDDRVRGLGLGADDYLPKPFAFDELVARVHALGRRAQRPLPPVLRRAGVELDPARGVAARDGRRLDLTAKELAVLRILLAAAGAIVSAEELLEWAWDEHADPFTNTVRVTVSNLRRKLGEPPLIETVTGAGYVIR